MANLDWVKIGVEIQKALRFFESQNVRPTLRTLYYNLVSQNIIGNTKSTYKQLSRQVVNLRKSGAVAWDALEDSARNVYGNFADDRFAESIVEDTEDRLREKLESFNAETILNEFFDYMASRATVSRWAEQPIVAEIWIEKEALAKTILAWTESLGVKIRVNKGYSSWTFLYENARDLASILRKNHDKVAVFYLGDMDPSGKDMERFLHEALEYFDLDSSRVELRRLSVTDEQVVKYHLPPKPEDAETLAKLRRDSRSASYTGKFIVELDAMVAFVPTEFRNMIVQAVNGVWDQEIYLKLRKEAQEKNERIAEILADVKGEAKEKLRGIE